MNSILKLQIDIVRGKTQSALYVDGRLSISTDVIQPIVDTLEALNLMYLNHRVLASWIDVNDYPMEFSELKPNLMPS